MAKKIGAGATGPSITYDKGFPEARLDRLAEVDPRIAKKLARRDENGDGRVQIGEVVDAGSKAWALRYLDAVDQIARVDGHKPPSSDVITNATWFGGGALLATGATSFLVRAAIEVASGQPTDPTLLLVASFPALGVAVEGVRYAGRGAKAAIDGMLRHMSPAHRALADLTR
jgi:hypothetical protein